MPLKTRQMLIRRCLSELQTCNRTLDTAMLMAMMSLKQQNDPGPGETAVRRRATDYTLSQAKRLGLCAA